MRAAEVFEGYLGEKLPVIVASRGPHTFGHWVSAPDFGRGLANFLFEKAVSGPVSCGINWNAEGVVDGAAVDDQSLASTTDPGLLGEIGMADCVDTWRLNNSHFGDFAANHYNYYHRLAVEAARRYRATRQSACRAAAYTIEGWGEHYLTDSTAAGHAFNPPGDYDLPLLFQTFTGLDTRMRIHDYLNDNGARMNGAHYADGVYWGDHSETHTADQRSIAERADGDPQHDFTMRLARMSLGQVIGAAECGDAPDPAAVLKDRDDDPRRLYASNESMCGAMFGNELRWWQPNVIDLAGIDIDAVEQAIEQCKADEGAMRALVDGAALAQSYFPDKYPFGNGAEQGLVSPTIDGQAMLVLEDLGCEADAEIVPAAPNERDVCGNVLCERPLGLEGKCPAGMLASAGCCVAPRDATELGEPQASAWHVGPTLATSELDTPGAVAGGAAELLPLQDTILPFATGDDLAALDAEPVTLRGGSDLSTCGSHVSYAVHEARVKLPATGALDGKALALVVHAMDEGLRVQVDGHLVAHVTAVGAIQLLVPTAGPEATHVIRVTHVNSCGAARPLGVSLEISDAKSDAPGGSGKTGGCDAGQDATPALGLLVIGLLVRRRRQT